MKRRLSVNPASNVKVLREFSQAESLSTATADLEAAAVRLATWCRARDFAGYDPFDGLNSRLFRSTPLKHSRLARLAWTQTFKRSPLNLRTLAGVPAERNAKGLALFALAALARWRRTRGEDAQAEAKSLLDDLAALRIGGAAWGYNFDWQGRAFFAPRGTPTIVPTAFAVRALVEAWREFGDEAHLELARRACLFITEHLPRSVETSDEICFAYSPLDRTRVFNASLLAAEVLASVAAETHDAESCELALRAARYVVRRQERDGRWAYGAESYQSWADNFHTAFLLSSLIRIRMCVEKTDERAGEITASLERGYKFWRANFFGADGFPKYYPQQPYPADAHSAGAAIITLLDVGAPDKQAYILAAQIARWTIRHMQDERGFFYYQQHRRYTNRIPYMRWSQAWMLYGLERLLEVRDQMSKVGKENK